jgi:hypothetical protein
MQKNSTKIFYYLKKLKGEKVLIKTLMKCFGGPGGFFKSPLAAGGSMLLHPALHGLNEL